METPNEINSILTNQERDQILYSLFLWKDWKVDSSFLYKWKWAELYEKISKDKTYPFIDTEIETLKELKKNKKFIKILKKTKYITDVWSWDWQKAVTLLTWTNWDGTYIAEDYSRQMLEIAENNIKAKAPRIKLWSSQKLNNWIHLSQRYQDNMYLFLWWTVCNMSDEEIIKELEGMDNSWIIAWNNILLSYFTAPNTQEEIDDLIKIYNSENNRIFHKNWMKMLWLSNEDFEFDTVYEKDNPSQKEWPFPWKIKWIIRAKKDCTIKLSDWKTIKIIKWQEFTLHYSRRFTKEWIKKLFNKSWCSVVFDLESKWDSIVLLKRKPRKLWKVKNMITKTLAWILVFWSLATWINRRDEEKKQKDKDKAYAERESKQAKGDKVVDLSGIKELSSALQLDELDNIENKQAIFGLYNIYVWEHKDEWKTTKELIQWFWKEYWWMLVKNFWVRHTPYDFMTRELIDNTKNMEWDMSSENYQERIEHINVNKVENLFEYNDWNEIYYIIRVYIWANNTPIYLAAEKTDSGNALELSTETVSRIKDKSGLDSLTLENNKNLKRNYITHNLNKFWSIIWNAVVLHWDNLINISKTVYVVYTNWDIVYVTVWRTASWKQIWLASRSPNWPFTIKTFNEISESFINSRFLI